MNRTEDRLHASVWRFLNYSLPTDALAMSIENRNNGRQEGARRKARGCLAGTPDMMVLWNGRMHFIELKTSDGKIHSSQRILFPILERTGHPVAICRSVEDVHNHLKSCGVPLRAEVMA
ncbi:VRR-NUC domain-containing protein [Swingsia samuiensis]|uniref:VRR-NUC domain-containing protein n=1 Tax=Swingsia samuiensis TaxID=1293412 RepID=A0A4Y6UKV8_9PROT|nr:VRR-NUC domain-containing protein [Swingsia samuiensis]QDH17430.1 VRR-NUC domain-containing protein [Swingsia samuiensis]